MNLEPDTDSVTTGLHTAAPASPDTETTDTSQVTPPATTTLLLLLTEPACTPGVTQSILCRDLPALQVQV